MKLKKKGKFRVSCKEIATNKVKMFTTYESEKEMSLDEFFEVVRKKVEEI